MSKTNTLWVEKYRPDVLENYIGNEHLKNQISKNIEESDLPHYLFHGQAGTGKTTLAKILVKNIDCDYLYINASDENNVDNIRTKVKGFAMTYSTAISNIKIVILDECDFMSVNAQAALRNLMESYSAHCKFILTCNYKEKVIDPLQSRCQDYELIPPNRSEVGKHCVKILESESVEYDVETIATIIDACYPDIRRVINYLQKQSIDGNLNSNLEELQDSDYKLKLIELLGNKSLNKKDAFVSIRKLLMKNKVRDFTPLFSLLYDRLDKLTNENGKKAELILLLARYQNMDSMAVDKEINIMAMFVEMLGVLK